MNAEQKRIQENTELKAHWNRWGSYLSDRQWGTVREDYSPYGNAWEYFSQDHARSRAYRWGEDGLAGFCDRHGEICFALALWNGKDPILKERLFGLTNNQGNHGEDVKEYYFYLDNTPTHSYMRWLYKYPQQEFPYQQLIDENAKRSKYEWEFELLDTGIFDDNRYFDVMAEYAKASPEDICIRISITNRSSETAAIDLLPTLWFRNTWSWTGSDKQCQIAKVADGAMKAYNQKYGERYLFCENNPPLIFTENETNYYRLYGTPNPSHYVKDSFHQLVIHKNQEAVNPDRVGTKAAAWYHLQITGTETAIIKLRFVDRYLDNPFARDFENVLIQRQQEADEFYESITPNLDEDSRNIHRQAFAGLLWNKQFYHYDVETWLAGDKAEPIPPGQRLNGRNHNWRSLYAEEVISMPDKWEYPWFAAWDLAFHCLVMALIDSDFAKRQLLLLTREWYMHQNGQLPAYEWAFGDVNPPVQAWAAWRVYKIEEKRTGNGDRDFLERMFHRLMLNFIWWVNRKDPKGKNLFQGGFLGLDNIGVFDRSKPLPTGGYLEQADGTAWMGMFALNMLAISLELSREDKAYADMAIKFFEHFMYIADCINHVGYNNIALWDKEDNFYYDALTLANGQEFLLKIHSMVGLTPLFAVDTLEPELLEIVPGFKEQLDWFLQSRPQLAKNVASMEVKGVGERRLLSITSPEELEQVLKRLLDENEFLSPYGIRSLSRYHLKNPFIFNWDDSQYQIDYEPAESTTEQFGGNSNWRGPVWFPLNFLLIESLQKYHHYFGDDFKVECPTGSGNLLNLWEVAAEISQRLTKIFRRDSNGKRPVYGGIKKFQQDPHWRDLILFYEYFHGDNGAGLGASHQTGWTALVAKLIQQLNTYTNSL
ncbi:glucosidase [Phormidium sp. LEGE 05292]|uniref:MGH1-like glycoside hydrolase domain-containing protein n=1 Tax=[Phormidium] sp. LEGE 05292 TaxID=767427 RepID=UPI001882630E|nr:glucosidase [Phormidium sp. LEGE 05292]MBE9228342.1 glucosidase [Phormidium sp. LEGE 05292]